MNLQEYQIEARKTAHHTAHLGLEYCVMKLAEELGELDEATGTTDREAIKLEGGDIFWYLADIYTRYGVVITERKEEPAFRRVDHVCEHAIPRYLTRAVGSLCGAVAKAMAKGVEPHRDTILVCADIILALTCRTMQKYNHSIESALLANLAKLAARQAAGTVLGGLRTSEPGLTSNGNGWISMVSRPPIRSGDLSDDVQVTDEHTDDDGNLSMTIVLPDDMDSQTDGYIVRLEPGVWLCPEEDDMGRTLQRQWAAVYPSEGEAQSALAAARRHRAFQDAVIERVSDS